MSDGLVPTIRSHAGEVCEELVSVSREGVETTIRFDDGLKLRFQTGQLLRELLTPEIVAELVARVGAHVERIEGRS